MQYFLETMVPLLAVLAFGGLSLGVGTWVAVAKIRYLNARRRAKEAWARGPSSTRPSRRPCRRR